MIYQSLNFLTEQVNNYLKTTEGNEGIENIAILKNVAHLTDAELLNLENVLLTLVNISEESTMKNLPNHVREGELTQYRNAPIYLNLYILFSSCVIQSYANSLKLLSHVVEFFQGKHTFTNQNSPTAKEGMNTFKISMDLYSPTFEQANYLWSTLGGKQFPYVLYRMRIVEVFRDNKTESRGVIKEIAITNTIN